MFGIRHFHRSALGVVGHLIAPDSAEPEVVRLGMGEVPTRNRCARHHGKALSQPDSYPRLDVEEVVGTLRDRPQDVDVIMTGRDAAPELVEFADLVTEMTEIKHPFQQGIKAQPGIDY